VARDPLRVLNLMAGAVGFPYGVPPLAPTDCDTLSHCETEERMKEYGRVHPKLVVYPDPDFEASLRDAAGEELSLLGVTGYEPIQIVWSPPIRDSKVMPDKRRVGWYTTVEEES